MQAKIYISYRRDDDPSAAARVRDGLALRFRHANLFIDVNDLFAGQRFDEELAKALAASDVLIAIIGQRWMELLKAKIASGERDYVREEIAGALQRKIIVVPARVGREGHLPPLPRAEDLPEDIRKLALYQKHDVTHERFGRDIAELSEAIVNVRRSKRPQLAAPRVAWGWIGATAVSVLAIGYVAVYSVGMPVPWPRSPSSSNEVAQAAKVQAEAEARRKTEEAAQAAKVQAEAEARRKTEEDRQRDPGLSVMPGSGQSFRDVLANGQPCPLCPEMVVVPEGSFLMGTSEEESGGATDQRPVHRVTFTQPFAVGRFAVTFEEWDACAADGGCRGYKPDDLGWGRGRRPVINVSWSDAKAYADWLSKKTNRTYRLLSESEREYVTRAGTSTPYWWGPLVSPDQANYRDGKRNQTVSVDSFQPNQWGLYQVHGNVWEWTEDCRHSDYKNAPTNGSAWTSGDCAGHMLRGGSFKGEAYLIRAAMRLFGGSMYESQQGSNDMSFRVARTLSR